MSTTARNTGGSAVTASAQSPMNNTIAAYGPWCTCVGDQADLRLAAPEQHHPGRERERGEHRERLGVREPATGRRQQQRGGAEQQRSRRRQEVVHPRDPRVAEEAADPGRVGGLTVPDCRAGHQRRRVIPLVGEQLAERKGPVLVNDRMQRPAAVDRDHAGQHPLDEPVTRRVHVALVQQPRQVEPATATAAAAHRGDGPCGELAPQRDDERHDERGEGEQGENRSAVRQQAERGERRREHAGAAPPVGGVAADDDRERGEGQRPGQHLRPDVTVFKNITPVAAVASTAVTVRPTDTPRTRNTAHRAGSQAACSTVPRNW